MGESFGNRVCSWRTPTLTGEPELQLTHLPNAPSFPPSLPPLLLLSPSHLTHPPTHPQASLTIYQSLSLTTGLLHRWRLYYSPLSTLIRLLALQAICWPATHFTLSWLEVGKRPVVCWAVVGSTTCVSRSVQIWVVSNLWWEVGGGGGG